MKKILYTLSIFVFMIIGISIVNANNGPIIEGNKVVKVGEQTALTAKFPNSCLGKNETGLVCAQNIVDVTSEVEWKSSNQDVATVINSGIVTGVKEGKTTITATYTHSDSTKVTSNYEITVTKSNPKEYEHHMVLVLFNEEKGQYDEVTDSVWNIGKVGSETKITPKLCDITGLKSDNTYDESFCSNIEVVYNPQDSNIVKATEDGKITNLAEGETIIVAKAKEEITIKTTPPITETPTVSLKIKVSNQEAQSFQKENKNTELVEKVNTPNTASPASIIAIAISIVLILAAVFYYFTVINKLQTWKKE